MRNTGSMVKLNVKKMWIRIILTIILKYYMLPATDKFIIINFVCKVQKIKMSACRKFYTLLKPITHLNLSYHEVISNHRNWDQERKVLRKIYVPTEYGPSEDCSLTDTVSPQEAFEKFTVVSKEWKTTDFKKIYLSIHINWLEETTEDLQ